LPSNIIYSGKDASSFIILQEHILKETGDYLFGQNAIFLGFPIYAEKEDIEPVMFL
jgi:hypothetical protein